jgi:hypothetical protein
MSFSICASYGVFDIFGCNMPNFGMLRQAWAGQATAAQANAPEWPQAGFAIEGDFSGIQKFVLRPVPGAGGAARRLRSRSFRL